MMYKRYIKQSFIFLTALLLFTTCTDDKFGYSNKDGEVTVTFRPKLDAGIQTRAIGDGKSVNRLDVVVYEENGESLDAICSLDNKSLEDEVKFTLLEGRNYKVLFWAQHQDEAESKPYTIGDNGVVHVDYTDYLENGYEKLDAFYAIDDLTVNAVNGTQSKEIVLTRPLAQLNFADEVQPASGSTATVALTGVVTTFNPFATISTVLSENEEEETPSSFTFTSFPEESLTTGTGEEQKEYNYVASVYLFPTTVSAKLTFNEQTKEIESISLVSNKRTNVIGSIVQEPEQLWDGTIPVDHVLTTDSENRYIIDEPADLAWLSQDLTQTKLVEESTFLVTKDINMNCVDDNELTLASLKLPKGSRLIGDGEGHTIKNIRMEGALLGDATDLTVEKLTIENATISSATTHVGVLVNTLKGNGSFSQVTINKASVTTTNGAAGGIVGYIVRQDEKDRSESLGVSFTNCTLSEIVVSGTRSEGKFVGLLSGYDNQETVTFDEESSASVTLKNNSSSLYVSGNQSTWLEEIASDYDNWLGDEVYCRGTITYGGNRFVPKWDGERTVEPLLADPEYDGENVTKGNNSFVVYSPFDLAGVREKTATPAAIYLKENIDMFGQGSDGKYNVPSNFDETTCCESDDDNNLNPFSSVTTLDGYKDAGENYTIYNLSISRLKEERAAFILTASGTTVHKNINFNNCQTVAVHKDVETDAKAYGAILISNVEGIYTMKNVHAYDCKVFALQKVGTLGARISGTSTVENCSVESCYVENYECSIAEYFTSGNRDILDYKVECYESFYPHGEVGGMFGFVQGNSTISDCVVKNTKIYAIGQDDKQANFKIKDKNGDELNKVTQAIANGLVSATGLYLIPGRHVSTFIGDIRAGGTITLTNCKVDEESQCTNRWDKHNDTYNYIGQCYYVKFLDEEGTVTVDGNNLTLADCNRNTTR
ncbi:MAG: FimB/Mfa2 family fimbrial subunit [Parabacteroides sp.]|nr:FimB/Mfa2 family fimbrial subunit [Parabacteroides sp.]